MPGGRAPAGSFLALQQLARSFGEPRSARRERELQALALDLGSVAVPLLLRVVGGPDADARAWAADLLQCLGARDDLRPRIVAALHRVAADATTADAAKVAVLSVLGALGETSSTATFRDPAAIHESSLAELAGLLTNRPDVALAADLLVHQLEPDALLDFVDGLARSAPRRAVHLVDELLVRTDLPAAIRGELVRIAAPLRLVESEPLADAPRRRPRLLLLRRDERTVVVVLVARAGGYRCLCLLVDGDGRLADGFYRDDATAAQIEEELLAPLVADGYARGPARAAAVRTLLVEAARRTVATGAELPSAYFLGRDLLDLGDAHQPARWEPELATTLLGRAVDLLAANEPERARPLLERCVELAPDDPDAASSHGLCLMAAGDLAGARRELERAARLDPDWPLHHWNLAALAHREGRLAACYLAMRRFLATRSTDPDHARRVAIAEAYVADHERLVRLEHPDASPLALAEAAEAAERRPLRASPRKRRKRASASGKHRVRNDSH